MRDRAPNPWIFDNENIANAPANPLPKAAEIQKWIEEDDRDGAWRAIVAHYLIRKWHQIVGVLEEEKFFTTEQKLWGDDSQGGKMRWLVGHGLTAPELSTAELEDRLDDANASGYLGVHRETVPDEFRNALHSLGGRFQWELIDPWLLGDRTALPSKVTRVLRQHFGGVRFNILLALRSPWTWAVTIGLLVMAALLVDRGFGGGMSSTGKLYLSAVVMGILLWWPYIQGYSTRGVWAGVGFAGLWVVGLYQISEHIHWGVALAVYLVFIVFLNAQRGIAWTVALTTVIVSFYAFAGAYNPWRDLLLIVVSLALFLWYASRHDVRKNALVSLLSDAWGGRKRTWSATFLVLSWLACLWLLASLLDIWMGPEWKSIDRLPAETRVVEKLSRDAPQKPAIALSGGGYRAALMHAGVLTAIADEGVLPASLTTVSGGSIIGGYYALGGDPQKFKEAVIAGRFNLKRELADIHNLPRLLCPGRLPGLDIDLLWFCAARSRTDVQADLLDRTLFGRRQLRDTSPDMIPWLIATTDLWTGNAIGISSHGVVRVPLPEARFTLSTLAANELSTVEDIAADESRWSTKSLVSSTPAAIFEPYEVVDLDLPQRRLAWLAAASGAFPGAFNSMVVNGPGENSALSLSDGGILDNRGLGLLIAAGMLAADYSVLSPWRRQLVLISDGGSVFEQTDESLTFGGLPRAIEAMYTLSSLGIAAPTPNSYDASVLLLSPNAALLSRQLELLPRSLRDERGLRTADDLERDVERCRRTFADASTLEDQFDRKVAEDLFYLGHYIVYLHPDWPKVRERLIE